MSWFRRIDYAMWRHLIGLTLLIGGFGAATLLAQGMPGMQPSIMNPSLLEQWLKPDVVIGGVMVLLYVGELRGDIRRLKNEVREIQNFKNNLHEQLNRDYMSRETIEARFSALMHQQATRERDRGDR